jgi:DNA transformation protein
LTAADRAAPPASGLRDHLADLLSPLGKIESKRVFGLQGLKAGGTLLGFIIDERLYLRTDEESRKAYLAEGAVPFAFDKRGEQIVTSYYSVPDRLYDDPETLLEWARRARAAADEAPSAKKRRQKDDRKSHGPRVGRIGAYQRRTRSSGRR